MRAKKRNKRDVRYIPLADIKEIDDAFLTEMLNVKQKLNTLKDAEIIKAMHEVLLSAYVAAIELKTREREVDYDIKLAEIEARADELRPVRHGWAWRLLFRPLTNRAQDIIEERAELDAECEHTVAEKLLDEDWEKLFPKKQKKLSKRELKRQAKKQQPAEPKEPETPKKFSIEEFERYLQELADDVKAKPFDEVLNAIKNRIYSPEDEQEPVENVEKQEAEQTDEPIKAAEPVQAQSEAAPVNDVKPMQEQSDKAAKQLPGQMTLDDVQAQENAEKPAQAQTTWTRPPRPPRSCRKQ